MSDPIAAGEFGIAMGLLGGLVVFTMVWPWFVLPALVVTLITTDR